jgi:UDP-N-acetylmuramate dehydrogenase
VSKEGMANQSNAGKVSHKSRCDNPAMLVEKNVPLQPYNTFGIVAKAKPLVRVRSWTTCRKCWPTRIGAEPKFVLGGGSNIVLTGDVQGRWCSRSRSRAAAWCRRRAKARGIVEAGAGENWHDFVAWTLRRAGPAWRTWP